MRFAALLLAVSPSFVFADTITARIAPSDVIVYPQGAVVQRVGEVALPAGMHTLVMPDLPYDLRPQDVQVTVAGATVVAREWREETKGPKYIPDTAEVIAAKQALENAKDAVTALADTIAGAKLGVEAANAQIAFLSELSKSKTLPDGIDTLRDLSKMIAEETLAARKSKQNAEISARELAKEMPDLKDAVGAAQLAYDSLLSPAEETAQLSLTLDVPAAATSAVTVKYLIGEAAWLPTYDMHLSTGDAPELLVKRGAAVQQTSGERWDNVNLTLSTLLPFGQSDPRHVRTQLLRLIDPELLRKREAAKVSVSRLSDAGSPPEPIIEAPVFIEESAAMGILDTSGIEAIYTFAHPTSVDSTFDGPVTLTLGELTFDAEIAARAVPMLDETAFRMVSFTNTSDERLLPSQQAKLYVDGTLVAESQLAALVPGEDTEIGFGPLHGLRLTRTVLDRNEGDRGIISRSNEKTEDVRIDVENLTSEPWNVTLLDRVPYTQQEDLSITWNAAPAPDVENHEDRRGILEWDLDVAAGTKQSIILKTKITWPDGMILR